MKLKYKWAAVYQDGTVHECAEDDVSVKDPTRSSYFDVDHSQLIAFALNDGVNEYFVDLRDGHFETNQVPFNLHDTDLVYEHPKLLYFHRNTRKFAENTDGKLEETSHTREWHLGWKAELDGKEVEFSIKFD